MQFGKPFTTSEYKHAGVIFREIKRTPNLVIFKDVESEHYEIHKKYNHEYLCPTSKWGQYGWTAKSLEQANKIFDREFVKL